MKLPKNYFSNLTINRYRDYLKLLPVVNQSNEKNVRIIVTLIFTFFAMSFFGIFAIKPTLSTIVTLNRQLADSQMVHQQLTDKITALSSLQAQYQGLQSDLPAVFEAIPLQADVPMLAAQILGLAKKTNVTVASISTSEIELGTKNKSQASNNPTTPNTTQPSVQNLNSINTPTNQPQTKPTNSEEGSHYIFTVRAQGTYEELMSFARSIALFNRIVTIDTISINKDTKQNILTLDLTGKAYFLHQP